MKIPPVEDQRKAMDELFQTTRYHPKPDFPKDEHGMTIVEPEPDDE